MSFFFVRLGEPGRERPFVVRDGIASSIENLTADIDGEFFDVGGIETVRRALDDGNLPTAGPLDSLDLRIGAPIRRPGKVVCIGLNYRDHAEETGAAIPAEPVVFMKDPYTVVGPYDDILIPRGS